jgi:hypothetical protein
LDNLLDAIPAKSAVAVADIMDPIILFELYYLLKMYNNYK